MQLRQTKPVLGALLAFSLTGGAALAAKLDGANWCRVEPASFSSVRHPLNLQSLLGRHEAAPRHVAARRLLERPQVRSADAAPFSVPAHARVAPPSELKVAETSSCAGARASILCPGYQLVGLQY